MEIELRDFFISYTEEDLDWAKFIAAVLKEEDSSYWMQYEDFVGNIPHNISKAHEKSKKTIVILSTKYVEHSAYGKSEWEMRYQQDPAGEKDLIIIFRTDSCKIPSLLQRLSVVDIHQFPTPQEGVKAVRERIKKALNSNYRIDTHVLPKHAAIVAPELYPESIARNKIQQEIFCLEFWLSAGLIFGLFATYPISMILLMPSLLEAERWIKHEPAYNVFGLFILPLIFGLEIRSLNWRFNMINHKKLLWSLIIIMPFALGSVLAFFDALRKAVVQPFYFKDIKQCVYAEKSIREAIVRHGLLNGELTPLTVCDGFNFGTYLQFFENAGFIAYLSIALDSVGYGAAFLFFFHIVTILIDGSTNRIEVFCVPIIYCSFILWFPFRIYSDWYLHFFEMSQKIPYSSFVIFFFMAVVVFVAIEAKIIRFRPFRLVHLVVMLLSIIPSFCFSFFPETLQSVWIVMENMNAAQMIILNLVTIGGIAAILYRTLI